jgi:hypothetical protein
MFATTFLGHQGWLFRTDKAAVIVDPLLCEDFGGIHALEYRVFPPRVWAPDAFPSLDAIVLSHEHDDHFDIPSLAKLHRDIPLYLSARSSVAGRRILEQMGFAVHPLLPGQSVRFSDLELTPFTGDHASLNCGDEWDTLPFLVRSTDGHGSFFSMVDITITQGHVEWAAAKAMRPGLVSWTNNALDWSHMADYLKERVEGTQQCFMAMGVGHKLIEQTWGTPVGMVMCAGGFSFTGSKTWLNDRVFCVDTDAVCKLIGNVYKNRKFWSGVPGQTFTLKANKLASVDDRAPWLGTAPHAEWPARGRGGGTPPDFGPATGTLAFDEAALHGGLAELAGALVGGTLFRGLSSILTTECNGAQPTFCFVLRREGPPLVLVYDMPSCAFVQGSADTVAGIECFASDLAAVLAGEMGAIALTFGRARLWNHLRGRLAFDPFSELNRVSHPLRKPAAYLRTYERIWARHRDVTPTLGRR